MYIFVNVNLRNKFYKNWNCVFQKNFIWVRENIGADFQPIFANISDPKIKTTNWILELRKLETRNIFFGGRFEKNRSSVKIGTKCNLSNPKLVENSKFFDHIRILSIPHSNFRPNFQKHFRKWFFWFNLPYFFLLGHLPAAGPKTLTFLFFCIFLWFISVLFKQWKTEICEYFRFSTDYFIPIKLKCLRVKTAYQSVESVLMGEY